MSKKISIFARRFLSLLLVSALNAMAGARANDVARMQTRHADFSSDTPAQFNAPISSFNYLRREAMIPMRDGVKLHTVIMIAKGITHAGIVLTRTPYNADAMTTGGHSDNLGESLRYDDNTTSVLIEDGYIRVVQDIRGKYGSEGDYIMQRPIVGPQNPTQVSDATDAYDTIDWLVKHVPESNGKVAIMGISYDGFESLMALVHPHPALRVAISENPLVDGWIGDDWFHNGAFREQMIPYIYEQTATRANSETWWSSYHDDYDMYLGAGTPTSVAC